MRANEYRDIEIEPLTDGVSTLRPNLYLLAVGVSRYRRSELRLEYPAKDAADVAHVLKEQEGRLFERVQTKVLVDEQATAAGIKSGLTWLMRQTTEKDIAVVMLAGHGINEPRLGYCFLAEDYSQDPDAQVVTVVTEGELRDLLGRIGGKRLLLMDTCHAGHVYAPRRNYRGMADVNRFVRELQQAGHAMISLLASTGEQMAAESPNWGNGAFTKALIEGLRGQADPGEHGVVRVLPLYSYVCERVKELTNGSQTPTISMPDGSQLDFPLALTDAEILRRRAKEERRRRTAEEETVPQEPVASASAGVLAPEEATVRHRVAVDAEIERLRRVDEEWTKTPALIRGLHFLSAIFAIFFPMLIIYIFDILEFPLIKVVNKYPYIGVPLLILIWLVLSVTSMVLLGREISVLEKKLISQQQR